MTHPSMAAQRLYVLRWNYSSKDTQTVLTALQDGLKSIDPADTTELRPFIYATLVQCIAKLSDRSPRAIGCPRLRCSTVGKEVEHRLHQHGITVDRELKHQINEILVEEWAMLLALLDLLFETPPRNL